MSRKQRKRQKCALRIRKICIIKKFTSEEIKDARLNIKHHGNEFSDETGREPERFFKNAFQTPNVHDIENESGERAWLLYQKMLGQTITDSETILLSSQTNKELTELSRYLNYQLPSQKEVKMEVYHDLRRYH